MITTIFITLFVVILFLDYRLYKRWIKFWNRPLRYLLITLLVVANFLPLVMMLLFKMSQDNVAWQTHLASWIFTVYIIVTLVRLLFYVALFTIRRTTVGVAVGVLSAAAMLGLLVYSIVVTRTAIEVERVEIRHADIPSAFDNYRIVHFSDLHIGSMLDSDAELDTLVGIINRQDADLVVFSGDLVHIRHNELNDVVAQKLASICSRDGVVAVLGNHDTGVYVKDSVALPRDVNMAALSEKIAAMRWRLLADSTIYIGRGRDSIAVTGVAFSQQLLEYRHSFIVPDMFCGESLYENLPDSIFNITVSHLPQLWERLKGRNKADLTLAGHVHAMQMKCCIGDVSLSPAMLMYREWSGLYGSADDGYLYVNDGIGSVGYYMRIGAHPRVTVLTLHMSVSN